MSENSALGNLEIFWLILGFLLIAPEDHGDAHPEEIPGTDELNHGEGGGGSCEDGGETERCGKDVDKTTGPDSEGGDGTVFPTERCTSADDEGDILTRSKVQEQTGDDEQKNVVNTKHEITLFQSLPQHPQWAWGRHDRRSS